VLRNVTGGKANVGHCAGFSKHGFRYAHSQHNSAQKTPWMRGFYFRDWRHPAGFCCIRGSESLGIAHCRPLDSRDDLGMVSASSNRPAARAMACSSK
jgi:hypothetical protein